MFLCIWNIIKKKQHTTMAKNLKTLGFVLIILGAIIIILSHFLGWNNYNSVNLGSVALMIAGLITYIKASKKLREQDNA